jgi:GTP cyclohydrolase I
LVGTPRRYIKALKELASGYQQKPSEILSAVFEEKYDQMVIVRGIEAWSLCEHHLLPFRLEATVGYLPQGKVLGLSKIARLVYCFAKRLQVQERLTEQIAHALDEVLGPLGVGVLIRGWHTCMAMRGVRSDGEMVTSCLLGALRDQAREEFLRLAGA